MKNNAGFSLVELIVVIAIMAMLIGVIALGYSSIAGTDAKECASDLNTYLAETKTGTLGKDYQELKIYADATTNEKKVDFVIYHYQEDPANPGNVLPEMMPEVIRTETVGKSSVEITCNFSDSNPPIAIDSAGNSVTLAFNRASGAFEHAKIDDIQTTYDCVLITIQKGSRVYTIELIPTTGKHRIQ